MMNEQKQFRVDEETWQCECGNTTFRILRAGDVICTACDGYFPHAKVLFMGSNIEHRQ